MRELGQHHMRNKMFRTLMQRARMTIARITDEKTMEPLDDNNASYLDFFTRLMGKLEEGAKKADELVEEECRDLLTTAMMCLFSNLLQGDGDFDFNKVVSPVLPELHHELKKEVRDHVADYV